MKRHPFGALAPVTTLTLGGGGIGMLWGATTEEECRATVHAAIDSGVNLLDLAPRYGDGKAESIVGAVFNGKLPDCVRVTSKCNLGSAAPALVEGILRQSITNSLARLRLEQLDIFFLHSNVIPDERVTEGHFAAERLTRYSTFVEHVRPLFEKFVEEGLIGAWGLTGIGQPDTIIRLLHERPAPTVVQCIANLLDSPGGLKFFDGPARPRDVMAAARANGVGIMGIRAVQAVALTAAVDRELPADHPEMLDYAAAAGYRALCSELGEDPALLAHRYALSLDIDTLVLGVKNSTELAGCVAAAAAGVLSPELMARIDASVQTRELGR